MRTPLTTRVLQIAILAYALFIPFSIAGMNIAFGFGALAWLVASVLRRRVWPARPLANPLIVASVVLVLSAIPSVLISENASRAWDDWSSYWQLFIVFWVAANVRTVGVRDAAFWTLFASTTLSCVVAVVQRAGGIDIGPLHIGREFRVGSTLYTMTFAGIVYQTILFDSAQLLARRWGVRLKLAIAASLLLQFGAIMLTMTRGAWVALVGGLGTACVLARNRIVTVVALVLFVALALFSLVNFKNQGRSIPQLLSSGLDKDSATRVVLWDIAWDLFKRNPVLGVGMGDYSIEADKLLDGRFVTTTVDTHNVYLHLLATRGVVGFVPFLWFWFVLLRELWRRRRDSGVGSRERQYAAGAFAAAVAILIGALTELNIDDSEVFMAFMFIVGIALARAPSDPTPRNIAPP